MSKKVELDEDLIDLDQTPLEVENPEEDEKAVKSKKSKKKSKSLYIGIGVVVVLVVAVVLKVLLGGTKANAFDVTNSILTNELGTFSFTLDVRSSEAGTTSTTDTSNSIDDLNNLDSVDIDATDETSEEEVSSTETSTETASNSGTDAWGNSSGTETGYWKYPNYKISISGTTMSTEPLETQFTVTLATEYYNDTFTDVTVKDGNYYINIEQMRYWLVNSKDSYLTSVGEQLPEGSKYLVIPESEFYVISRYAEDSETDLAKTTSLRDSYLRFSTLATSIINTIRDDSCVTSEEDTSTVSISGDKAVTLLSNIKGLVDSCDTVYDSYISGVASTYNNDTTQAMREKDNVIEAFHNLAMYFDITDLSTMNLQVSGNSRNFSNGSGNQTLEANWNVKYTANNTDYSLGIALTRSGDTAEITVPDGSTMTTDVLNDDYLIFDVLNQWVDYLNFTDIDLSKQLEITPSYIKSQILDMFIELVNDSGTYDEYLTEANVQDYIDKYANFVQTDTSTNNEIINAKLVSDFFDSVNSVTGGVVQEVEKEDVEEVAQYTTISDVVQFDDKDVNFTAKYNEDESTANLVVVDLEFMYHTEVSEDAEEDSDEVIDDSITVDLTNFSLHTLLSSSYPANNEVILKDNDNSFDMSQVETEIKIQPNVSKKTKLYIVISSDDGYMDLWYGDTNFGELINH
jgi:hypothetical protein